MAIDAVHGADEVAGRSFLIGIDDDASVVDGAPDEIPVVGQQDESPGGCIQQ